MNLYECALCFVMGPAEDVEEKVIKFAFDKPHDGTYRICRDREGCNARRMARIAPGPIQYGRPADPPLGGRLS